MKNIHVLPTDKPSRLYTNMQGVLSKDELKMRLKNQNIYITSDEEIKEGCLDLIKYKNHTLGWYLMIRYNSTVLIKYDGSGLYFNTETTKIFKIILTTDQDLIKDGIQAIHYEFLEWFVKNPNCEEVEVIKTFEDYTIVGGKSDEIYYKIILPKKETKQETTADYIDRHIVQAMVEVAKQKMYSEEEVINIIYKIYDEMGISISLEDVLKQFKK